MFVLASVQMYILLSENPFFYEKKKLIWPERLSLSFVYCSYRGVDRITFQFLKKLAFVANLRPKRKQKNENENCTFMEVAGIE